MVSKQFRLALDEIGEMLLQHAGHTSMQLLAPRAQQPCRANLAYLYS
jgi:hypothetical protein